MENEKPAPEQLAGLAAAKGTFYVDPVPRPGKIGGGPRTQGITGTKEATGMQQIIPPWPYAETMRVLFDFCVTS